MAYILDMDKVWQIVKQYKYYVGAVIGFLLLIGVFISMRDNENPPAKSFSTDIDQEKENQQEEPLCEVFVDISGAVEVPGVYCLESTAVVNDLLDEAGGLGKDHCALWVSRELNKASPVENGMKLYVPFQDDEECNSEIDSVQVSSVESSSESGKISLNTASQGELEKLPGVGPALSQRIIESRPYSKLEDIKNVKGIGDSLYSKIAGQISL
jgi:competence protein ComEA